MPSYDATGRCPRPRMALGDAASSVVWNGVQSVPCIPRNGSGAYQRARAFMWSATSNSLGFHTWGAWHAHGVPGPHPSPAMLKASIVVASGKLKFSPMPPVELGVRLNIGPCEVLGCSTPVGAALGSAHAAARAAAA